MQRWERACPRSSSSSVAELDAELRSLLDLFLFLIPWEFCLSPGTAVPGINPIWGSVWPLRWSAMKCLNDLYSVHSRTVRLLGTIPPSPAQKVWAQACPVPAVGFRRLIL